MAGPHAPAVRSVYEQWAASPREGQTFLDYLTDRGVIDRVGARGVLHAWQGGLDDRDTRQLFNPETVGRAAARLAPPPLDMTPPPTRRLEVVRAIGSRLGRYVVKGVLGWGGCGPVYLAVHPTLRVPVAVKPIIDAAGPSGGSLRDGLQVEARLLATVAHPNVVRVWDYEDGDEPFLVLEYINGESLRDRLADRPLNLRETFTLTVQMALALRAAQRVGVTHHDVKPANVLLTPEDGFKLSDFGLARCRRKFARAVPADSPRLSRIAAGTLNFMAPEQFENCHDYRSDIYSLGLTVYHALTGCMPIPGDDYDTVMLRHKRGGLEPVHHLVPGAPWELSDLVRRMTAINPDHRFDTYDELIRAAEAAFGMRLDLY